MYTLTVHIHIRKAYIILHVKLSALFRKGVSDPAAGTCNGRESTARNNGGVKGDAAVGLIVYKIYR